jgi:hypothetical protein
MATNPRPQFTEDFLYRRALPPRLLRALVKINDASEENSSVLPGLVEDAVIEYVKSKGVELEEATD